jgi:hypothetical protein
MCYQVFFYNFLIVQKLQCFVKIKTHLTLRTCSFKAFPQIKKKSKYNYGKKSIGVAKTKKTF